MCINKINDDTFIYKLEEPDDAKEDYTLEVYLLSSTININFKENSLLSEKLTLTAQNNFIKEYLYFPIQEK